MKKSYIRLSSLENYGAALSKIAQVFFLAAIFFLLSGYKPAISTQIDDPQIVRQNGQKVLLLPNSLIESIRRNFHGFNIPTESDMTGRWLEEKEPNPFPYITWGDFDGDGLTDVAVLLVRDGQKEHAKHERHEKLERHDHPWKFVIFHQTPGREYKPAYEVSQKQWEFLVFDKNQDNRHKKGYEEERDVNKPDVKILLPQQAILGTVKKGVGWAPEGGDVPAEYKHDFDAIAFSIFVEKRYFTQAYLSLIYWENGKYHKYDE